MTDARFGRFAVFTGLRGSMAGRLVMDAFCCKNQEIDSTRQGWTKELSLSTLKNHFFDLSASGRVSTFAERLEWLLDGRKLTPWAKGVGMGGGSIDALRGPQARPPSHEFLVRIMRTENVSLSWLLGADTAPFLCTITTSDADTASLLNAHLVDEAWHVALFTDGISSAWLLHQPGALETDKGSIAYRIVSLIVGPSGAATTVVLANQGHAHLRHVQQVSTKVMDAIATGRVGTWRLFGDARHPGLWNQTTARMDVPVHDIQPSFARRLAENAAVYNVLPPPARAIVEAWETLPTDRRSALEMVVSSLVGEPPARQN